MKTIKELREKYDGGILSKTEIFLSGVVLLGVGLILGMIFTQKGNRIYGSYNGNNNGNQSGSLIK